MDYIAGIVRAIEAVTLGEANAAFRKYLDPAKRVMIYAGDSRSRADGRDSRRPAPRDPQVVK